MGDVDDEVGGFFVLYFGEVEEVREAALEIGLDEHSCREGLDVSFGIDERQDGRSPMLVLLSK